MPTIFPFKPDWKNGIKITHSFKTEVITSRGKQEQRFALRDSERVEITYDTVLSGGDLEYWMAWFARNQQGEFWTPDYTRWAHPAAPLSVGDTEVAFTSLPRWASADGSVFLWDQGEYHRYGVAAVSGNKIVLDTPLTAPWTLESRVHPGFLVRIDQNVRGKIQTNRVGSMKVSLNPVPGTVKYALGPPEYAFNYREVFLTKPNWRTSPDVQLRGFLEDVDFDRGVIGFHSFVGFNQREEKRAYLGKNPTETDRFLQFFQRMKGRQGAFFMPTWEDDLAGAVGSNGGTALTVPGLKFNQTYSGSEVYSAICIFYRDGSVQPVLITDVSDNGSGDTEVSLADPLEQGVSESSVNMVCLLPLWRFAGDGVTIEHVTNTVAQWQSSTLTLPNSSGWPRDFTVPNKHPGGKGLWLRKEIPGNANIVLANEGIDATTGNFTIGAISVGYTTDPDGATSNGVFELRLTFVDAANADISDVSVQADTDSGPVRVSIPPTPIPATTNTIVISEEVIPDDPAHVGAVLGTRIQLGERIWG